MSGELLDRATADLQLQFSGIFDAENFRTVLAESYTRLHATARVHTQFATLAIRFARERLTAIAKNQGDLVSSTPEVLFVCEGSIPISLDGAWTRDQLLPAG